MARKAEIGIDYFPMNTDIIHNSKVKLVVAEFGPKAWAVLLTLYCKIYREKGYWIDWADEDSKILFSTDECKTELSYANEVVTGCIRRSLFDKGMFDMFGILTSDRIQENYLIAKSRNKVVHFIHEFALKNEKSEYVYKLFDNVDIIPLNADIIKKKVYTGTQKEKESEKEILELDKKENRVRSLVVAGATTQDKDHLLRKKWNELKTKLNGQDVATVWKELKCFIETDRPLFAEPYVEAWNLFVTKYKLPRVEKINKTRNKKIATRVDEDSFRFFDILEKVKTSSMLLGHSGSWKATFDWIIENDQNYLKIIEGNYE